MKQATPAMKSVLYAIGKGNGLFTNLEQDRGAYATRSMHLDDVTEKRLINKNYEYKKKGEDTWTLGKPRSSFARDAWNAGTKEDLNSNRVGGLAPSAILPLSKN